MERLRKTLRRIVPRNENVRMNVNPPSYAEAEPLPEYEDIQSDNPPNYFESERQQVNQLLRQEDEQDRQRRQRRRPQQQQPGQLPQINQRQRQNPIFLREITDLQNQITRTTNGSDNVFDFAN